MGETGTGVPGRGLNTARAFGSDGFHGADLVRERVHRPLHW